MSESIETKFARMEEKLHGLEKRVVEGFERLEKSLCDQAENYVSKVEFNPVKKIVYGMVGLILVSVVGAILTLVLK